MNSALSQIVYCLSEGIGNELKETQSEPSNTSMSNAVQDKGGHSGFFEQFCAISNVPLVLFKEHIYKCHIIGYTFIANLVEVFAQIYRSID